MALLTLRKLKASAQMPHPPPTISARQFRNELEDLVDRVVLCGWSMSDAGSQQPIKFRQPPELPVGLITLSIDSLLHTRISLRAKRSPGFAVGENRLNKG